MSRKWLHEDWEFVKQKLNLRLSRKACLQRMAQNLSPSDKVVVNQNSSRPVPYSYPACQGSDRFDYSTLDRSVANFLTGHAQRIRKYVHATTIQVGKDLIAAKRYLSHGQFIRWIEQEVGIPARTAQAYMRIAHWATGKSSVVARLPSTLLFILSASSTPVEYAEDILRRLESGEKIAPATVKKELKQLQTRGPSTQLLCSDEVTRDASNGIGDVEVVIPTREEALREAVLILFQKLSQDEFMRVKSIMTNRTMLNDPELSIKLAEAFTTVA